MMKTRFLFLSFVVAFFTVDAQRLPARVSPESELLVIVFLAVDCPISQKYIPTLNRIHERYSTRGVAFRAIIPGNIKRRDLMKFVTDYRITFAVDDDKKYEWVKAVSANATPEVFVFDKERALNYRGAIDNWFYELGGYRKEPTDNYLADAIEALLAGEKPKIEKTKALGCFIEISS